MASDFDPRFDPAFQRGFDGPVAAPAPRRVEPAGRVELSPPPRVETARPPRVEPVETSPIEPSVAPLPPPLRGNPFIPALWIVAAVFTLGGAASQYVSTFVSFSPTASSAAVEYVLPSVLTALSPWLFGAGLAAAIATLVIHAIRWRPAD